MSKSEPKSDTNVEMFFTREVATKGKILFLKDPKGKLTDAWIKVCGRDSDQWDEAMDRKLEVATEKAMDFSRRIYGSLVIDWSFDKEVTQKNVLEVFRQAPGIHRQVVKFVDSEEDFFAASETV